MIIQQLLSTEINQNEKIIISLPFAKMIPIIDKAQYISESNNELFFVSKNSIIK